MHRRSQCRLFSTVYTTTPTRTPRFRRSMTVHTAPSVLPDSCVACQTPYRTHARQHDSTHHTPLALSRSRARRSRLPTVRSPLLLPLLSHSSFVFSEVFFPSRSVPSSIPALPECPCGKGGWTARRIHPYPYLPAYSIVYRPSGRIFVSYAHIVKHLPFSKEPRSTTRPVSTSPVKTFYLSPSLSLSRSLSAPYSTPARHFPLSRLDFPSTPTRHSRDHLLIFCFTFLPHSRDFRPIFLSTSLELRTATSQGRPCRPTLGGPVALAL
jgi:hypothetical protein